MMDDSLDSAEPCAPAPHAEDSSAPGGLPMPHGEKAKKPAGRKAKKTSADEKAEYAARRQWHYSKNPNYEKQFNRPPKALFDQAWAIIEPWLPSVVAVKRKLVPLRLSPQEKIALTVLVDYFLQGEGKGRRATYNDIFDEVCRKFSDHFVLSPARRTRDMKPETVRAARRDLLCNEININKLHAAYLSLSAPKAEDLLSVAFADAEKQQAFLIPPDTRKKFLECTSKHSQYFSSSNRPIRLWFDRMKVEEGESEENETENILTCEYCAEIAYNHAVIAGKSLDIIKEQSKTRLYFDIDAFNEDYKNAEFLKATLHKRLIDKFNIDPDMPRWKRMKYKISGKQNKENAGTAGESAKKDWVRSEIWSERDMFVYYASIMRGLNADLKNEEIVSRFEQMKTFSEASTLEQRYSGFIVWIVRTARAPAMVLGGAEDEYWKSLALELIKRRHSSLIQQYEQKRLEAAAEVQEAIKKAKAKLLAADNRTDVDVLLENSPAKSGKSKFEARLMRLEDGIAFLKTFERASPGNEALALEDVIMASIADWDWRREVRRELGEYDEVQSFLWQHRAVRTQVKHRTGVVLIRSRFTRAINRRYQPRHMWPAYVGKWRLPDPDRKYDTVSLRKRWFKGREPRTDAPCDLVGYDISSSQTQIIATLLGSPTLEEAAMDRRTSFKQKLAQWAFDKHTNQNDEFEFEKNDDVPPYKDANDDRLLDLCKTLWMRISYGSNISQVVPDQLGDPETYGPGWSWKNAQLFIDFLNDKFPEMKLFLSSAAYIGKHCAQNSPADGVIFIDPYDNSEVRWNPLKRTDYHLKSDGHTLILSLPASKADVTGTFDIGSDVRYEVDGNALRKMIAPCLIHMLDAFYSSLVMEKLAARGIKDFVGIHDCWLVPRNVMADGQVQDGLLVLKAAMQEAAGDWYRGLAPVYQRLAHYLGGHEEYRQWLRAAEECWKKRLQAGYVPQFVAKED